MVSKVYKRSEETRAKMRASALARRSTGEVRRDLVAAVALLEEEGGSVPTMAVERLLGRPFPHEVARRLIEEGVLVRSFGDVGYWSQWNRTEKGRAA